MSTDAILRPALHHSPLHLSLAVFICIFSSSYSFHFPAYPHPLHLRNHSLPALLLLSSPTYMHPFQLLPSSSTFPPILFSSSSPPLYLSTPLLTLSLDPLPPLVLTFSSSSSFSFPPFSLVVLLLYLSVHILPSPPFLPFLCPPLKIHLSSCPHPPF